MHNCTDWNGFCLNLWRACKDLFHFIFILFPIRFLHVLNYQQLHSDQQQSVHNFSLKWHRRLVRLKNLMWIVSFLYEFHLLSQQRRSIRKSKWPMMVYWMGDCVSDFGFKDKKEPLPLAGSLWNRWCYCWNCCHLWRFKR